MADSLKPTIVMVPGAWIQASMYESFLKVLHNSGYPTMVAEYPSFNPVNPHVTDVAFDSKAIRENFLVPLIEKQGKEIVIVMHSYGGMPGSAAATGLGVVQRGQEGLRGGVVGLIFISGFVVGEGATVADGQGGQLPPWVTEDTVRLLDSHVVRLADHNLQPSAGLSMPADPIEILAADVDPAKAQASASELRPHATLAFKTPSPRPAWADLAFRGRLGYIVPTEDKAIPKSGQEMMMQFSGQQWIVKELHGSHNSAFLLKEQEAAGLVAGIVETFLQVEHGSAWRAESRN